MPTWQRRGIGLHWQGYELTGVNPRGGAEVGTTRRRLHTNDDLPIKDEYRAVVAALLTALPREADR